MKPFFSVIIPTYNRSNNLRLTISSVLEQTYSNFEILVMDDGSTDDTDKVVASFNDKRIKYSWASNFGGPSRPRNRGIHLAVGNWVCFLDADDWWTKNKLQVCYDSISKDVDLIYHDLEIMGNTERWFRRKNVNSRRLKAPILSDLLLKGNAIANSSVVVRKSLLLKIGGINESMNLVASEDYNTWMRIAKLTDNFLYVKKKLGFYLIHSGSISHKDMSISDAEAVSEFISNFSDLEKLEVEGRLRYMKGSYNYSINNFLVAKEHLLFSLKQSQIKFALRSLFLLLIILAKQY